MFALPAALSASGRQSVVEDMAGYLVTRHGVVVDYAIHAPPRNGNGRNHHVHMLMTTRRMQNGELTDKCRELDSKDSGAIIRQWRTKVAELENAALEREAQAVHIEHRCFASRGIAKIPEPHRGKQPHKLRPQLRLRHLFAHVASDLSKICRAHFWVFAKPVRPIDLRRVARYVFGIQKLGQGSNATPDTQLKMRSPPRDNYPKLTV